MMTDFGEIPSDVPPAYRTTAEDTREVAAADWLDLIPGGRAAYNYVVREVSRFNLVGLQDIPTWQRALQRLAPIAANADTVTRQLFDTATREVAGLQVAWEELAAAVDSALQKLRTVGLGVLPVAALAGIAATLVAVAGGMYLFFQAAGERQQQVADLVNRLVALGKLSPEEAAALLRAGSAGDRLSSVATQVVVAVAALGALYLYLNRRRA